MIIKFDLQSYEKYNSNHLTRNLKQRECEREKSVNKNYREELIEI